GGAGTGTGGGGGTSSGGSSATSSGGSGAGGGSPNCGCFDGASWTIDNLEPCFFTTTDGQGNTTTVAVSTHVVNGQPACPDSAATAPADPWSTDSFEAGCTGHYELCYTLKAGDWHTPQPTDCTMITVCTTGDVTQTNTVQAMPPLPGWLSEPSAAACVQQFITEGGYGTMTESGTADSCGAVQGPLAGIVAYCPLACNGPNPPASCAACMTP
ncbi:MAG TPA: hypothetical protein VHB21_22300, partial [Minicystis sp.]|nr:hypothetical protein [Minicystis sp.]